MRVMMFILGLIVSVAAGAEQTVFRIDSEQSMSKVYPAVYEALEEAKFFVVFEPNIGENLSQFADRWGEDYNRNELSGIRSMVFCNGWYANQVSNQDPSMLALCPLRLTVIEKDGRASVLFVRPTHIAAHSAAREVLAEVEGEVIAAIRQGVRSAVSSQADGINRGGDN